MRAAFAAGSTYTCGGNLAWLASDDAITAKVPISPVGVQQLKAHFFSEPAEMPMIVKVDRT